MIVRLAGQTGTIIEVPPSEGDSEERLVRPAILVHEGTFQSQDGEVTFDEERIKTIVANHNSMIKSLANQYGGIEKMPVGAYPPILDQHADDSGHRVQGRLASLLRFEKRDIPGVGAGVSCATADIVFLGKDTVDKVKDGRIYHLSIGIDENTNTLGETSTVIEPACPGAMVLKKSQKDIKSEKQMNSHKLLKGGTPMGANIKETGASALRRARLSEIKGALTEVTRTLGTTGVRVRLEKKKSEMIGTFKRLMRSGKLTPAEYKGINLVKLAALDDEAIKLMMATFELREPVIMAGQRGSTQSINFSDIGKSLESEQRKRLRSEIAGDFKRLGGKKVRLAEGTSSSDDDEKDPEKKVKDTGTDIKEMEQSLSGQEKMDKELAEADINSDSNDSSVSSDQSMQDQIDELNTQIARIAGMVNDLMDSTQDENEGQDSNNPAPSNETVTAAKAAAVE